MKMTSTPSFLHCFAFLPYCIKVIRIMSAVESFTEMRAQGWRWRPALFWQMPFTESRIWNRNPGGFELLWSSPSTIASLQLFPVFPTLSPYNFTTSLFSSYEQPPELDMCLCAWVCSHPLKGEQPTCSHIPKDMDCLSLTIAPTANSSSDWGGEPGGPSLIHTGILIPILFLLCKYF